MLIEFVVAGVPVRPLPGGLADASHISLILRVVILAVDHKSAYTTRQDPTVGACHRDCEECR